MSPPSNPAPAERFTLILDGLCRVLAAQGVRGRLAGPVLLLLWS